MLIALDRFAEGPRTGLEESWWGIQLLPEKGLAYFPT